MSVSILDWPTDLRAPAQATLQLRGMTQSAASPFDGTVQTLVQPGWRWVASLNWGLLPLDDWRNLSQFLGQLLGMQGRFKYTHPMCYRRATVAAGTPLVNGASQTGSVLVTDGWTHSAAVMKRGDYFSWNNASSRPQLHQVCADVTSNSSGQATLFIVPPLRTSPADNAAIEVTSPQAIWMLANDDQGVISNSGQNATRAAAALDIVEALA